MQFPLFIIIITFPPFSASRKNFPTAILDVQTAANLISNDANNFRNQIRTLNHI
jgi:hypothetical protein